jgi:hypothetical protein
MVIPMKSVVGSLRYSTVVWFLLIASVGLDAQTKASCSFTLFTLPNSIQSGDFALGINSYRTVVGQFKNVDKSIDGFIRYSGGHLNFFAPGATTWFTARNDLGNSIGVEGTVPNPQGFLLHGSSGVTPIIHPKAVKGTFPQGINKFNNVVGYYLDANNIAHGFKMWSSGTFKDLAYPNAQQTIPMGINDNGTIVGAYVDFLGSHGFIYGGGKWTLVEYPGVNSGTTGLLGISDAGTIIGFNTSIPKGIAFLYKGGKFKVIAVPNAGWSTVATGISANGWITGNVELTTNLSSNHQFIAACQ